MLKKNIFNNERGFLVPELLFLVSVFLIIFLGISSFLSNTAKSEETKSITGSYSLVSVDNYYVGRQIVDGKAYYIYQISTGDGKSKIIKSKIDSTFIVKDNHPYVDIHKDTYVVHLPDPDKIKDYGSITTQKQDNTIFIPWFIYSGHSGYED